MAPTRPLARDRPDRCPGVLRPWPADDGALVRLRLLGGRLTARQLVALSDVAQRFGDGDLHLTARANLQLRGIDHGAAFVDAVRATGLLPSDAHDQARNVLVSPLTGLRGGRADLRPVAAELDRQLCADPALAALPGKFQLVLDDGRGDVVDQPLDLGLVALDAQTAQVRWNRQAWGETVALADAPAALVALTRRFLDVRGTGDDAAWHVAELDDPDGFAPTHPRDPRADVHEPPLPFDERHVAVPDGVLDPALARALATSAAGSVGSAGDLVVTPWRGVVVR